MQMRSLRRFAAATAIVAAVAHQGQTPAHAEGNTLVMAWATDATGLDPHKQTAFASLRLLELVYEPLVTLNAALEIQPALARALGVLRRRANADLHAARQGRVPQRRGGHGGRRQGVVRAHP